MRRLVTFLALSLSTLGLRAAEPSPGHSANGEAFDEGPRQAAVLIEGCGKVNFPVTTKSVEAQKFFNQGVGQIHGFWYFEAERSFRQVAMLDPDCAMAYWGCAMANVNNEKRASGFIAEATKRKAKASKREQAWIDMLQNYYADLKKDKKLRATDLIKDIGDIVSDYQDDLEAKAFLGWSIWQGKSAGVPMVSRETVDALLKQVFAKEPLHPAHHYIIHLWDDSKPSRAVASAAKCGQSAPGIAHMWHMPGHTFTKVDRNVDGAWQQEAATRVDHAYMIRTQILPDQIHNYAHNTEWLIRTWNQLGLAGDSAELAKNLIEIPRHPMLNTIERKSNSAAFGRTRLLDTLLKFEKWDDLLALDGSPWFDVSQNPSYEATRLRALGIAAFFKDDKARLEKLVTEVTKFKGKPDPVKEDKKQESGTPGGLSAEAAPNPIDGYTIDLNKAPEVTEFEGFVSYSSPINTSVVDALGRPVTIELTPCVIQQPVFSTRKAGVTPSATVFTVAAKSEPAEKPVTPAPVAPKPAPATPAATAPSKPAGNNAAKSNKQATNAIVDNAIAELQGLLAILEGKKPEEVQKLLDAAKDTPKDRLVRYQLKMGNKDKAATLANQLTNDAPGLALRVDALMQCGKTEDAKKQFENVRTKGALLDVSLPMSQRLDAIAVELGFDKAWRKPEAARADSGVRPTLDSLGPIHWHPWQAASFSLPDANGKDVSIESFKGKPTVVLFYLGSTCTQCMGQLKAFTNAAKEFSAAGIQIVAIGSENAAGLAATSNNCDANNGAPFPLLADPSLNVFKLWRCHDDFENAPLHGAFLVDAKGKVRWADISYDPFENTKFLLGEAKRLLKFE